MRRAVNTPDRLGRIALWQGGMEPNIPVGSAAGVAAGMERAVAGAEREQREGASGKWVAHWKMVHIVRPVWEKAGQDNQLGRPFPPADLHRRRRRRPDCCSSRRPHRSRRARPDQRRAAVRQRVRPGMQAAALKPADFFGNDDVLYLMEDMATGEIRLSILWEWLHKRAAFTDGRRRHRREGRRLVHAGLVCRLLDRGVQQAARRPATGTSTTTRRQRRCRSRARSSRPT